MDLFPENSNKENKQDVNMLSSDGNMNSDNSGLSESSENFFKVLFCSVPLLSFLFIFTGWGFIMIPFILIFNLILVSIYLGMFKRYNSDKYAIFSVFLSIVFAYISIVLNYGAITDGPHVLYLIPDYLGLPSEDFSEFFSMLLALSTLYFIFILGLSNTVLSSRSGMGRFVILPLTGLILVLLHLGYILTNL